MGVPILAAPNLKCGFVLGEIVDRVRFQGDANDALAMVGGGKAHKSKVAVSRCSLVDT